MTVPPRPLGWHPDPGNDRLQRWWDGTTWTPLVRPVPPSQATVTAAPPPPAAAPHRAPMSTDAKRALVITAVAAVLFAVWGYAGIVDTNPVQPSSVTEQVHTP